jgi:hypothetical protein
MKVSQTELFGSVAVLLYIVFFSHSPPAVVRSALSNTIVAAGVVAVIAYVTLCLSRTVGVLLILAFVLTMTRVTEHLDTGSSATGASGTSGSGSTSTTSSTPASSSTTTTGATNTPAPLPPPAPSSSSNPTPPQQSPPMLAEGLSYNCSSDPSKVYRAVGGILQWYPTSDIANSWNPNWSSNIQTIDCSQVTIGAPLTMNTTTTAPAQTPSAGIAPVTSTTTPTAPATPPAAATPPAPVMACNIESFAPF